MSRWWLVILVGWLLIAGSYAHEVELEREHEERANRACGCTDGARVIPVRDAPRPLEELLELAARRTLGDAGSAASRLPAPLLSGLRLELGDAHHEPTSDLALTGELPRGTEQLALLFEVRGKDFEGNVRVDHLLALTPATQLTGLGKARCETSLPIELEDQVTVAVAGVDQAGRLGHSVRLEAQLTRRTGRPECGHRHCSHSGLLALFLGMCWMLPTVAVMFGTLVVLGRRRSLFRLAAAEPMSLGQLHRLCSTVLRAQRAYLVLCLLMGAAFVLRYPQHAPTSVLALLAAGLAGLRYRAMQRLLRLAEQPGATYERRGPGVSVVHDSRVAIETFPSSVMEAAMRDDVPPMRAR